MKMNEPADIVPVIAVVIVTYGDRLELVRTTATKVLQSSIVKNVVLVDNGSKKPVLADHFDHDPRVSVLRFAENLGSAAGFKAGIERAASLNDVHFIGLLDDDNLVSDNYFDKLLELHRELGGGDNLAFSAVRTDREQYKQLLSDSKRELHIRSSFMGFSVPALLKRRFNRLLARNTPKQVRYRTIDRAPYGGLFASIGAIRSAGLPRADFLLYGDDHEYTRRLVERGVQLNLTDHVWITDIDQSWTSIKDGGSRWIDTSVPAWRIYYAARNQHFIELTEPHNSLALKINRSSLMARLYLEALLRHRSFSKAGSAMGPFKAAIRDAENAVLGANSDYPIPLTKFGDKDQ
jgi:GT2 family glycosyltransferase